jgi:hypothetical protein
VEQGSVVVPVALVRRVAVPVVHVVGVIVVRHADVSTARSVFVCVALVHGVLRFRALVHVVGVDAVDVAVVHIVGVIDMRHGDMPASLAVDVLVPGVGLVGNIG